MRFQTEFYSHIVHGFAGDAAVLLARLALNVHSDSKNNPVPFELLASLGDYERQQGSQGLNEFYALECTRACILHEIEPWPSDRLERLKAIAEMPRPPTLTQRRMEKRTEGNRELTG